MMQHCAILRRSLRRAARLPDIAIEAMPCDLHGVAHTHTHTHTAAAPFGLDKINSLDLDMG
jgi:hypothetical protein